MSYRDELVQRIKEAGQELIDRAESWLKNNSYNTQVLKWNTSEWGEVPADFGRK